MQKNITNIIINFNTKLITNSFITNIKNEKWQLKIQTLNAIKIILIQKKIKTKNNNKTKITQKNNIEKNSKYVIFYKSAIRLLFINHWFDVLYFLTMFSFLFFSESKKHVDKHKCVISIKNFISWVLLHYNHKL